MAESITAPLRILFMGSPEAALPCLNLLAESPHDIVGVLTRPDRPVGRGRHIQPCAVAARARELELPLFQPKSLIKPPFIETLEELRADLAIVVAYGKILKSDVLNAPAHGCWNVHFSLLPQYRGAAPTQWALINGETETGISIIRLVEALDAGPILAQQKVSIDPSDTTASLLPRLSVAGAELLGKTLQALESGHVSETAQDEAAASFAPQLKKEDGHIDWTDPALMIQNRIRGLNPWPGAYAYLPATAISKTTSSASVDRIRLKLYSAAVLPTTAELEPGTVVTANREQGLCVACREGSLQIRELQLEGKKRMTAREFLQGHPLKEGIRLQ